MAPQANQNPGMLHGLGSVPSGRDVLPADLLATGELLVPAQLPIIDFRSTHSLPPCETGVLPPPPETKAELWMDGDVIMCGCPDCRAPLSVRTWLMTAECWRCETVIELNEDQEKEVRRLLQEREARTAPTPHVDAAALAAGPALAATVLPAAPPPVIPKRHAPPARSVPNAPAATMSQTQVSSVAEAAATTTVIAAAGVVQPTLETTLPTTNEAPPPAAPVPSAAPSPHIPARRLQGATAAATAAVPAAPATAPTPPPAPAAVRRPARNRRRVTQPLVSVDRIVKFTPAWLISMLLHLLGLTLAAILSLPPESEEGPFIILSTATSPDRFGGDKGKIVKVEEAKFDLPLPKKTDLKDAKVRETMLKANQDAQELRLDDAAAPRMPDISAVIAKVNNRSGVASNFAARDPRLRVEVVEHEGGTTLTEAAVARGLRWLSNHQNNDGSWSLAGFKSAGDCKCSGDGSFRGKSPGTALSMLPFLGAGQTHFVGRYKANVAKGIRWMLENQGKDGDLRAGSTSNEGMYTHGQATIVLCEAFAMTGDEQLRIPAQKAIDFICKAQYRDGGWRYTPSPQGQLGDTSVVGWQLMALQSAKAANLSVPEDTLVMAGRYLDSVQRDGGSRYSYMAKGQATPAMTAEGLLCRIYLGWNKDDSGLTKGVSFLAKNHLPSSSETNIYYWYYGTQTMHHVGGKPWEEWNQRMRDILTTSQETGGHLAGSWTPKGDHASAGGRIYMTSLAVCTLEVYYRHLPIFRQLELERKK